MAKLRKVVLLLFALIYVSAAPLTVLYALGYIFSPTHQSLLQTGLISLNTNPGQATVWLDSVAVKEKTPVVLRNLRPGTYEIRIRLAGHKPWQRQIHVEAERAVRLEKILLFPEGLRSEIIGTLPLTRLVSSPHAEHLIVLQGNTAEGLSLVDLEKIQLLPLLPQTRYGNALVEKIFLHPEGGRALLTLRKDGIFISAFVEFENLFLNSIQRSEVTDLVPEPPDHVQWSTSQKDSLFYLTHHTLKRVDLGTGTAFPALAKSVCGFTSHARRLFVLEMGKRFLELNEKGKLRDILFDDPSQAQLIFGKERNPFYSIFFLPRELLFLPPADMLAVFLSDRGRLGSNKLPYFLDEGVQELAPSPSKLRVAYTKGMELWVVDFEQEKEKKFFERGPKPRLIYKGKEELSRPLWFYGDQYLLFVEGNRLRVQDFEGKETPMVLFEISPRTHEVALDRKRGFVYFAEAERDRLSRVKLYEGEGLLPRLVDSL